jgi:hypothetical protein
VPAIILSVALSIAGLAAQTKVTAPANKYSPKQDVELGREAAGQARQQLPIMRDEAVTSYVEDLGRRLVTVIPREFEHSEFRYDFDVVNVRDINAFALPGGPMFINRGMIEAAQTEGEAVSVMAHELSHVVLRHGTAQASKATPYQVGEIAGAILGAIVGGRTGSVLSQGISFGLGTHFLRYGREYERQADILGAQMMARAGYDPREMANMFKTIEKQGGSGGPEWLSDHPNPGNRSEAINKEATLLSVDNPIRDSRGFERVRAHLRELPRAPTTEEVMKNAKRSGGGTSTGDARPSGRVAAPSTRYTQYNEGNIFRVSVPSNWEELPDNNSVTFAPAGGHGTYDGQSVFTHGVQMGISRNKTQSLQEGTDELIDTLRQGNPRMGRTSAYRNVTVGGRRGLQTTSDNVSDATGQRESLQIVTLPLRDGNLWYAVFVAPSNEINSYQPVFQRVLNSVRLTD